MLNDKQAAEGLSRRHFLWWAAGAMGSVLLLGKSLYPSQSEAKEMSAANGDCGDTCCNLLATQSGIVERFCENAPRKDCPNRHTCRRFRPFNRHSASGPG